VQRAGPGVFGINGESKCGIAETLVALRTRGDRNCVFVASVEVAVRGERRPSPASEVRGGGLKEVTMSGEGRRFFVSLCEGMGRRKVVQWGQGQEMFRGGARVSMVGECLYKEDVSTMGGLFYVLEVI
jgi:hypothetical protein